eukprot:scaffold11544_cov101-Skeletonema_dohrnii-CCMP3373.AAC.1
MDDLTYGYGPEDRGLHQLLDCYWFDDPYRPECSRADIFMFDFYPPRELSLSRASLTLSYSRGTEHSPRPVM